MLGGNTLYGTTWSGGSFGYGTVFKMNADGTSYTLLKSFGGTDGARPCAEVVVNGSILYGTTQNGGSLGCGTVFKVNSDGTGYAVLKQFGAIDGAGPATGLVLGGSTLYGTTYSGGDAGSGTVFKINTDGTGFTVLKNFTGSDGQCPSGTLVLSGTNLYGTANQGGASGDGGPGYGLVFKLSSDGTGFAILKEFSGTDGQYPYGNLVLIGSTIYGTTESVGSSFSAGLVFKVCTDGTGYTVLKQFDGSEAGHPLAGLVLRDSTLYGTTSMGSPPGSYGSGGTVFQIKTDSSAYAVLKSFTGVDGSTPWAGLALSGTRLYGTTWNGGAFGNGTVFSLELAPTIQTMKRTNGTFTLTWGAVTGLSYQVQYTTNLSSSNWLALGSIITATNSVVSFSDSGTGARRFYRVVGTP